MKINTHKQKWGPICQNQLYFFWESSRSCWGNVEDEEKGVQRDIEGDDERGFRGRKTGDEGKMWWR